MYQIYPRSFADANGDGIGDLARCHVPDSLPHPAGRRRGVAEPVLPVRPGRRRLRRRRLSRRRSADRDAATTSSDGRRPARRRASGSSSTSCRTTPPTGTRGSARPSPLPRGRLPGPATSSATAAAPTARCRPTTHLAVRGQRLGTHHRIRRHPGQWYFHFFAKEQPDLNWDNPEVHDDFLRTLRFWSDRGVDGFRVDVAHGLKKDMDAVEPGGWTTDPEEVFTREGHPLWDRDDVHDVYAEWRRVFDEYDPPRMAVAETWVPLHRITRYAAPRDWARRSTSTCSRPTSTPPSSAGSSTRASTSPPGPARPPPGCCRTTTSSGMPPATACRRAPAAPDAAPTGSTGCSRAAIPPRSTRPPGCAGPERRPCSCSRSPALPTSTRARNWACRRSDSCPTRCARTRSSTATPALEVGRDGCRVPLPWEPEGPSFGFGAVGSHLPQPAWFRDYAVSTQDADPGSTLNFYRRPSRCATTCRAPRPSRGARRAPRACCTSSGRTGGRWWPTSARTPCRCRRATCSSRVHPSTDGVLPGETSVWLRP